MVIGGSSQGLGEMKGCFFLQKGQGGRSKELQANQLNLDPRESGGLNTPGNHFQKAKE